MQEKYSKYYLAEEYGVDTDNVVVIKNGEALGNGNEQTEAEYNAMLEYFLKNDFSTEEFYEAACNLIDVQSYIDYIHTHVYLCSLDMDEGRNGALWKSTENRGTGYEDGRWRWLLYDLDYTGNTDPEYYGVSNMAELNMFTTEFRFVSGSINSLNIFDALRVNAEFTEQFVLSFMDIANTCFSEEHVQEVFEQWGEDIHWSDDFFLLRYDYAVEDLAEEFSLTGTVEELTLTMEEPEGGLITLNTCTPDLEDGTWTGCYYTDYPVTLTAEAAEGYHFVRWTGDVESSEQSISVTLTEGGVQIEAVFEKNEE